MLALKVFPKVRLDKKIVAVKDAETFYMGEAIILVFR